MIFNSDFFLDFTGIVLNSLNSVLSFNNLDFTDIFYHGKETDEMEHNKEISNEDNGNDELQHELTYEYEEQIHDSTFVKQFLYFILFLFINLG